jgi:carbon monoxide dehydrogenase subunit G
MIVRQLMGQQLSVELRLTGYEAGRRLVLESGASGVEVAATLDLEPADEGTRLRFAMTIRAQNVFMTPVEGMVASAAEQDLRNSLERLRAHFAQGEA